MPIVTFHPAAVQEVNEIIEYLNEQSSNLGNEFVDELKRSENFLRDFPDTWPCIRNNIRRLKVSRFSYNVFYHIIDDGNIEILTVMHFRRKPFNFLDRL
jgi:plasmid stabilization system protein ParE